jgi:NitT/TauT family transport system permease protein
MGAFTRIGVLFDPLRLTGMYIPLPALIPLTIAWVGIGEPQIVLFLAICIAVVLLPFVVASVQAVPDVYLDTARTLGASRGQLFRYVLLTISWPTLFRGLKISFAVGWTWIMLAEVIGVNNGLGYIINTSQRRGYIEHVYIVIALVIGMAFLSNAVWNLLSRLLFPYQESEK